MYVESVGPVGGGAQQPPIGGVTQQLPGGGGGGETTELVALHGGTGTGRFHWSKQLKALSREYRVHLPDLPGHGRTPLPDDGSYSPQVLVDAVRRLLTDLGPPVHVLAFSMGGHASLALASSDPGLFASLVLVGVSLREHRGLDAWRSKFDPDELQASFPLWACQLSKLHEPLGGPAAWKDVCRRDAKGLRVDVDVDSLAGLGCPTMLVRGDRDMAVDPGQYAELRLLWPHADELVVPGGGHDVQLTRARVVGPALVDFLDRARRNP
jgi:pimeloyl-ACP methyl ester carboxylesterase